MSVIVITGGSRGIGASTAELCARQGHGVILTYNRNPEAARAVVRRIESAGGNVGHGEGGAAQHAGFASGGIGADCGFFYPGCCWRLR